MKLLYFYRVPLPDARADAIQVVNTCAAVAGAGGDVRLHVETLSAPRDQILDFYGVRRTGGAAAGAFDMSALGTSWSWPFFNLKVGRILKQADPRSTCLFLREVRPYVPGLIARAKAAGFKVIFEAHNVSAALVKEKAAKASFGPRSFSLASPGTGSSLPIIGDSGGDGGGGCCNDHPEESGDDHGHDHAGHDHDDHDHADHDHGEHHEEAIPLNADPTPAPPPPDYANSTEVKALRKKAEERAALEESIIRAADGLICTQRATFDGLKSLVRPGLPAVVLGNGTQSVPASGGVKKDIDILYCGSLKQWKGVDILVAAMQTLYPFKLTIVGPHSPADLSRIRQAALAVGAIERVTILPPVKPSEVWGLYARAKVGVIPLPGSDYIEAREFTSPLKLFEMMAAGLPVVASRLRSILEYVTDGHEAVLTIPDSPRALADAIRRILTDEAFARSLADAARTRASEFTWDRRGAKLLAFAEQVMR